MLNAPFELIKNRRDKVQRLLKKQGLDALLVTCELNVTYLTGFTGDSSFLVITPDKEILVSDSRYTTQIEEECGGLEKVIRDSGSTTAALLCRTAKAMKLQSLGIEADHMTKSAYDQFAAELDGVTLVDTFSLVEKFRAIKDTFEISEIRRSISMAERTFNVIRQTLRGEQTEADVAHEIEHQIRLFGGDRCAFEPIVGVGPRAALPHAVKTDQQIGESPFVLIDWGAKAGLYASDLTRVLVTGKPPAKLKKIYNIVLQAQMKAIELIRPGISVQEVDRAARGHIEKSGYGKNFGHGLGHGFGLEIHEAPYFSSIHNAELKPGMVVTIEPGIYLPGWGGVRIEDDILVTRNGHEVLSSLPKSWEDAQAPLL